MTRSVRSIARIARTRRPSTRPARSTESGRFSLRSRLLIGQELREPGVAMAAEGESEEPSDRAGSTADAGPERSAGTAPGTESADPAATVVSSPEHPELRDLGEVIDWIDGQAEAYRLELAEQGTRTQVAALVSRRYARSLSENRTLVYNVATYSFEFGTRDDRARVGNDWGLQYGNGAGDPIHCDMVSDDVSLLWDLGDVAFHEPVPAFAALGPGATRLIAQLGHVYLLHVQDHDSDLWVKFEILELVSGRWLIMRWELAD